MSNSRHKLTDELAAAIAADVAAGAYPHVAAEAHGIPRDTFERWLAFGRKGRNRRYRRLADALRAAGAQARRSAEQRAHAKDVKLWLRSGPGKDKLGDEGWTVPVRPVNPSTTNQTINVLGSPDFLALLAILRRVLAPFPDALAQVTAAIEQLQPPPPPPLTIIEQQQPTEQQAAP